MKKNKLSGVLSYKEWLPGDLFVCQQMIEWLRHGYHPIPRAPKCNCRHQNHGLKRKSGNPVDRTVSKVLPLDLPCSKTYIRTPKSCFHHVYCESYWEIRKFGNSAIGNLTTLLSDRFKIATIRFPMSKNILVDTKIRLMRNFGEKRKKW